MPLLFVIVETSLKGAYLIVGPTIYSKLIFVVEQRRERVVRFIGKKTLFVWGYGFPG
jgi:hypothetical protein